MERNSRVLRLAGLHMRNLEEKNFIDREIIDNDKYMKWLDAFTIEYPQFNDKSWIDCKEDISDADYQRVIILGDLYEAIEDYANMNYIVGDEKSFSQTYNVKFNNVIFKIGFEIGQEMIYFVTRNEELEEDEEWIDFENIKNGQKTDRSKKIDGIFSELDDVLVELCQENISNNMIKKRVAKSLVKIREN